MNGMKAKLGALKNAMHKTKLREILDRKQEEGGHSTLLSTLRSGPTSGARPCGGSQRQRTIKSVWICQGCKLQNVGDKKACMFCDKKRAPTASEAPMPSTSTLKPETTEVWFPSENLRFKEEQGSLFCYDDGELESRVMEMEINYTRFSIMDVGYAYDKGKESKEYTTSRFMFEEAETNLLPDLVALAKRAGVKVTQLNKPKPKPPPVQQAPIVPGQKR